MCVPDLKGSQGTFCLCTTRHGGEKFREGGVRVPITPNGTALHSYVPGPEDPLSGSSGGELRVNFEIRPDLGKKLARMTVCSLFSPNTWS